jgi:protein tyrosine/serine phosphatase
VAERRLDWEALRNARDLGGLAVSDGQQTRFGVVVRSDTLRQLTPSGWQALAAYGIATVIDLRFQVEIDANEPLDAGPGGLSRELGEAQAGLDGRPPWLRTVAVSVLGEPDRELGEHFDRISRAQPDEAASTQAVYLEMLALFRPRFAAAVAAIADAPAGGVLVHCHAGKDRTGLVVALLLAVAGVGPEEIAADYALSGANLASSLAAWIDDADDAEEGEHRRRVALSPARAMLDVLDALNQSHGGAAAYLLGAGLSEDHLERVRARLVF